MFSPSANVAPLNISTDKSELLVGSFTGAELDPQLWALPVLGGSPRRVSDLPGWDGIWLPNGNLLIAPNNELSEISPGGLTSSRPFQISLFGFVGLPTNRFCALQ